MRTSDWPCRFLGDGTSPSMFMFVFMRCDTPCSLCAVFLSLFVAVSCEFFQERNELNGHCRPKLCTDRRANPPNLLRVHAASQSGVLG